MTLIKTRHKYIAYRIFDFFFPFYVKKSNLNFNGLMLHLSVEIKYRKDFAYVLEALEEYLSKDGINVRLSIVRREFLLSISRDKIKFIKNIDKYLKNLKGIVVHCDSNILDNYILEKCNDLCRKNSFSLQHSLYPEPNTNDAWRAEYEFSNSTNFISFDKITVQNYKKFNEKRNYFYPNVSNEEYEIKITDLLGHKKIAIYLPHSDHFELIAKSEALALELDKFIDEVIVVPHPKSQHSTTRINHLIYTPTMNEDLSIIVRSSVYFKIKTKKFF